MTCYLMVLFALGAQSEKPEGDQDPPLHWHAAKAGVHCIEEEEEEEEEKGDIYSY